MCVYVCVYIYIYIHTYMYIHIYTCRLAILGDFTRGGEGVALDDVEAHMT